MGLRALHLSTGGEVTISVFKLQNAVEGQNKCHSHLKPSAKYFTKSSQESRVRDIPFGTIDSITKDMCFCFPLHCLQLSVLLK